MFPPGSIFPGEESESVVVRDNIMTLVMLMSLV